MPVSITVNGTRREVDAPADTPLLYVLRNDLEIGSPQFGCGLSQCGACSVLVDGKEVRSCVLPVRSVADKQVTTIEGLPARWASQKGLPAADAAQTLHPVQQAWIDEQVPHVRLLPERHDDQGHRTARSDALPDGRPDQDGVHERAVAAPVPLRHLLGDRRGRAARGHAHGEGEVGHEHTT